MRSAATHRKLLLHSLCQRGKKIHRGREVIMLPLLFFLFLFPFVRISSRDGNAFTVPPCSRSELQQLPWEMHGGQSPQMLLCWPWPCGLAPRVISDARINLAAPSCLRLGLAPFPVRRLLAVSSWPSAAPTQSSHQYALLTAAKPPAVSCICSLNHFSLFWKPVFSF